MNWQPSASIDTLRQRAKLITAIRTFFNTRGYLEVETPVLAQFGVTDVYLSNIKASFRGRSYCLQTSPEYHMKRLLVAGSGPIFQIGKAFRDDELGRWHNPEFTMLEWYQIGIDHHALLAQVDELLQSILGCDPMMKKTYQDIFLEICDVDPLNASISVLKDRVKKFDLENVLSADEADPSPYLFLLMTHVIEPVLAKEEGVVGIYHFPPAQAALAQINNGVAERFEVYYKGIELANGFHELGDATLQRARFTADCERRQTLGLSEAVADSFLLAALEQGLPPCSGVALGVDRLVTLALNKTSISEVLSFSFDRT